MAALTAGTVAPSFSLLTTEGKEFSLEQALKHGPVIAAFFKISCPVCQYALPFIERLHKAYRNTNVTVVGISQNGKSDTERFVKEYGLTIPVLLDDSRTYQVSNAYGLTNVPTIFYISQDGEIEISRVGWSKTELQEMSAKVANTASVPQEELFYRGENVVSEKAG